MPFTNEGRRQLILRLGSDTPAVVDTFAIGSGSGTATISDATLVSEVTRFPMTGSPDFTTNQKVIYTGDRNSVQMSGISLTEFGLFTSGPNLVGSIWARESFSSITFDGTNELRIEYTIEST